MDCAVSSNRINQCVARTCELRENVKDKTGLTTRWSGQMDDYCTLGREELRARLMQKISEKAVSSKVAVGSHSVKMFNGFYDTAAQILDDPEKALGDAKAAVADLTEKASDAFTSVFEKLQAAGAVGQEQASSAVASRKEELSKKNEAFAIPNLKDLMSLKNNPAACGTGSVVCFPISIPNPLITDKYFSHGTGLISIGKMFAH